MASAQSIVDIVDINKYVMMSSDGRVFKLEQLRDLIVSSNDSPQVKQFLQSYFSSDMYTTVEFDNAVYVIWHNSATGSPVVIHHFAPGSSLIINTYITPVFYRESSNGEIIDIYNQEKEMVNGLLGKAIDLDMSLSQYVTDDFAAYSYFGGGPQDLKGLQASGKDNLDKFYANYDDTLTRTRLSEIANSFSVVEHGRWTIDDENGDKKEVGSNLNIFYFDAAAENMEDRKIQTAYFYNSTSNMIR